MTAAQVTPSSPPPHGPPPVGPSATALRQPARPGPAWHRSLDGLEVAGTTVPQAQASGSRPAGKPPGRPVSRCQANRPWAKASVPALALPLLGQQGAAGHVAAPQTGSYRCSMLHVPRGAADMWARHTHATHRTRLESARPVLPRAASPLSACRQESSV